MRLYEFDDTRVQLPKIVALINQLKDDLDHNKIPEDFSVDDLLDYFQRYNLILDRDDLYSMLEVEPMNDLIKNIQGDKVVFKGQSDSDDTPTSVDADKEKDIVSKMAKSAMKK